MRCRSASWSLTTALLLPSVLTGLLVAVRVPASPVGGALAWVGAAPAAVFAVEDWGRTAATDRPLPGATIASGLVEATWPWLFLGFVALVLVFPDGFLPGRRWRVVAALAPFSAALLTAGMAPRPVELLDRGRSLAGGAAVRAPRPAAHPRAGAGLRPVPRRCCWPRRRAWSCGSAGAQS